MRLLDQLQRRRSLSPPHLRRLSTRTGRDVKERSQQRTERRLRTVYKARSHPALRAFIGSAGTKESFGPLFHSCQWVDSVLKLLAAFVQRTRPTRTDSTERPRLFQSGPSPLHLLHLAATCLHQSVTVLVDPEPKGPSSPSPVPLSVSLSRSLKSQPIAIAEANLCACLFSLFLSTRLD